MNKHQLASFGQLLVDWLLLLCAWGIFFSLRKEIEGSPSSWGDITQDDRLWQGLLLIPFCWLLLFAFLGSYKGILTASRLSSLQSTFVSIIIGSLVLLFTVLSDDLTLDFRGYLYSFLTVFLIHFGFVVTGRFIYLSILKWLVRSGIISWNICVIGENSQMLIPSFVNVVNHIKPSDDLFEAIGTEEDIDEIWIADFPIVKLEKGLPFLIGKAGNKGLLIHEQLWRQLTYRYKATPKLSIPFVSIAISPLSWWQRHIKRLGDLLISFLSLLILSPWIIIIAYKVYRSSEGRIFYKQERIGRWGVPFQIIKFRTMIENAESSGPLLASSQDPRCTPVGAWMRKWRLDEIPQFLNVIRGEMSLVGPRPERAFYSDQLIELNQLYPTLWQVRPGITSWGQIKYGYASSINEMIQRFRFDLLYIENMGLLLDLRILYYTLIVLFQGKGR